MGLSEKPEKARVQKQRGGTPRTFRKQVGEFSSKKSGTTIPKNASKNPPELRPVSSTSDKRQQESCPAQISFQEQKGIGSCEDTSMQLVRRLMS